MFRSLIFIICTAAIRFCSSVLGFRALLKMGLDSMICIVRYFTRTASSPSRYTFSRFQLTEGDMFRYSSKGPLGRSGIKSRLDSMVVVGGVVDLEGFKASEQLIRNYCNWTLRGLKWLLLCAVQVKTQPYPQFNNCRLIVPTRYTHPTPPLFTYIAHWVMITFKWQIII